MPKDIKPFEQWPFRTPSVKKISEKLGELTKDFQEAKSNEEALKVYKRYVKLSEGINEDITHVQVLFTLNTKDKKYEKANNAMDEGLPLIQKATQDFEKAMLKSPYRPFLEEKLGSFLFKMMENAHKGFDEKIIPELIEENKLSSEYSALVASAQIEFRGGVYNLPQMGKFMQDLDRNTRKEASEAYYGHLEKVRPQIEEIYDKLVHLRDKMAKKLGYKNYIELGYIRMGRFDYNAKDVAGYREAIRENVTPLAGKLLKAQFKRTGIRKPESYDISLAFADGNPDPIGDTKKKIELARTMYNELSPETAYCFSFMADHHVLDLEAKPGKQSGGYMTYFPKHKTPFIFSNFNGTSGDVDVLTHEFGHSFQAFMSAKIKVPEYRSPTMESCEIHSMSMEFFAEPWMHLFFKDPKKYCYVHLADSISFLPYGVTVDEYQHWVYEHPNASKQERNEQWHALELKYTPYKVAAYGKNEYLMNGGRWLTQGHIFASPFYYIDYTLAQVMAFQFFNLDRKNHKLAWKRYVALCKMGGKFPFRTLVTKDHMKDPFEPGVIKKTIRPLIKVLNSYGF